jgi:hypothetical protein
VVVSRPLESIAALYVQFAGTEVFAAVLALCAALACGVAVWHGWRRWPHARHLLLVLLWAAGPSAATLVLRHGEFLTTRYLWWVSTGLALLVGSAALYVTRPARYASLLGLLALAAVPVDWWQYRADGTSAVPMRMVMRYLEQHLRHGDVVVIDPNCRCGEPIAWDYFVPQYFPNGTLPIVETPGDAARVWYVRADGWPVDDALFADVQDGRAAGQFVGPWHFLWRLYEAPPDREGQPFVAENGDIVTLHGVEIVDERAAFPEYDTIDLRLWWSVPQPVGADYSVSVAVMDVFGNLVAQADGPPAAQATPSQMTAWQPGTVYAETRSIELPPGVAYRNDYSLVVVVYQWWDGQRLHPDFGTRAKHRWQPSSVSERALHIRNIEIIAY